MFQRKLLATGLAITAAAIAIALAPGARPANASPASVSVSDFQFTAANVTVNAGETVTWTLASGTHTVTSDDGRFASSPGSPGDLTGTPYTVTFNTPGTYYYHCFYHGTAGNGSAPGAGMVGSITVLAVNTPTSTATSTATAVAATNTATSTPVASATAMTTPVPTSTVAPAPTPTAPAGGPALISPVPTQPSGGAAGAGAQLPTTGAGRSGGDGWTRWITVAALAAAGAAAVGVSLLARRRI